MGIIEFAMESNRAMFVDREKKCVNDLTSGDGKARSNPSAALSGR